MAGSVFVIDDYDPNDFTGFSLTKVVPVNATATGAPATVNITSAAAVAASQAAAIAAVAIIAATLPAAFNSRNLPADILARCDSFNNPTDILTQKGNDLLVIVALFYLILIHLLVLE